MANYNKVILVGNITRDPQVRYTPGGTAVAEFGLAVNRQWKNSDGENKEEVCFIDVHAWGRAGEVISEYTSKGDPILIEGRLQLHTWQGQDGQKRSKHVVVVEAFQFLGRRGAGQGDQSPPQGKAPRTPQQGARDGRQPSPPTEQEPPADSFGGEDIPF